MIPTVLVTGGAGYIGSHTCKALAGAGFRPVTYDDLSLGHARFVRWGPLIQGDTRDTERVETVLRDHEAVAVIHFAALSSVAESTTRADQYHDVNVSGLASVLEAMDRAGCRAIVFSSSAAVYGQPDATPIAETAPLRPINPYGDTKRLGEAMLAGRLESHGLGSIALRYFNAAGADPAGEIGEFRAAETHLIPRALMAIQGHLDDFQVFGSDYPTPDGTAIRDYVHVSDLADAHVLALRRVLENPVVEAFNIGTGRGHSVAEVLSAIAEATGHPMGTVAGPRRVGDPARLIADPGEARRILDFEPHRSSLQTIVETAWAWHQHAHPRNLPGRDHMA